MNVINEIERAQKDVLSGYEDLALLTKNPTHISSKIHDAINKLKSSVAALENLEAKLYSESVLNSTQGGK